MLSTAWLRQQTIGWSLGVSGSLPDVFGALEFVQSDPIRAPARAQDLILWQRVPGYRVGDLDRAYPDLDIDEDALYAYGFVARRLRPFLHPRRSRRAPTGKYAPTGLAAKVLRFVREHGVTHPRDVHTEFGKERVVNDWGGQSNETTLELERLRHFGLLRVARRESGVRLYEAAPPIGRPLDLAARRDEMAMVIARNLAPVPEQSLRTALNVAAHSLLPTGRAAANGAAPNIRKVVADLVASGALVSDEIDGLRYLWPAGLAPVEAEPAAEVRFLAPFDPVVWDRRRFEHLWGWPYRFEAYVPAAKRQLGYYAMPLLWRDQVIGWANCAPASDVRLGFVNGRPRQRAFTAALDKEMSRLAEFLSPR